MDLNPTRPTFDFIPMGPGAGPLTSPSTFDDSRSMYIEMVRQVVEEAVAVHAAAEKKTISDVLKEVREHIDATAREHQKDEPAIDYQNALCRLGYLYRHAPANATLFERVLRDCPDFLLKIKERNGARLHVCSVGGGPGTELLGLSKFLLRRPELAPSKIQFTVLDRIPQWAETWQRLADAVEDQFKKAPTGAKPSIAPSFLPMDVCDPTSYKSYAYHFSTVDIVVFNYLFSENKTRLAAAAEAARHLLNSSPVGALFLFIDRHEADGQLTEAVRAMIPTTPPCTANLFGGTIDRDEDRKAMGDMLMGALGNPRVKFFTDNYRDPTAFWTAIRRT
ncbi:MAG: hypothetical protein IPG45_25845 [Deltaproteobacteria bacterium]|nr:hypothetical protein [Deltaproteobacteria bacterium]